MRHQWGGSDQKSSKVPWIFNEFPWLLCGEGAGRNQEWEQVAGQEIIEEILAGDYSVSEEWSDYGYVMNRKPTRPAFGSGDREKEGSYG